MAINTLSINQSLHIYGLKDNRCCYKSCWLVERFNWPLPSVHSRWFFTYPFIVETKTGHLQMGWVGQDHVHHPFVWRNAKSFYCFLLQEKAGLHFQCILKSILHEKTTNESLVSLYTLLRACTKQLCRWPCSLTENISECWVFYPAQVFSVR